MMTWWKSWLLTILQKCFPPEKPNYQDALAYEREKVVHPIYALELVCYKHDRPIALEERSVGVWHCPICSKPKPAVWYDEIARQQIAAYIPPEKQTDPFAEIHQQLQERRALMRHATRSIAHKIHLSGAIPREDRFLLDDNPTCEVPTWRDDQAV